jgi:hypothetical protein
MQLSPGEVRGRYAFAALMIAVGATPFILLLVQAARFGSRHPAANQSAPVVHASAMIETSLLLVAGMVLAAATAVGERRRRSR